MLYGSVVMDDVKTVWSQFIVLMLVALLGSAAGAEVEFISLQKRKNLEEEFSQGSFPDSTLLWGLWKCDLFGMRSQMQVQRNLNLYFWSKAAATKQEWQNQGPQPIFQYQVRGNALVGTNDVVVDQVEMTFEDQIRKTKDGRWISQFSMVKPTRMVLAYATCRNHSDLVAAK